MSLLEACINQQRLNAQAFDAMADRLILEAEITAAAIARNQARAYVEIAERIAALDNANEA